MIECPDKCGVCQSGKKNNKMYCDRAKKTNTWIKSDFMLFLNQTMITNNNRLCWCNIFSYQEFAWSDNPAFCTSANIFFAIFFIFRFKFNSLHCSAQNLKKESYINKYLWSRGILCGIVHTVAMWYYLTLASGFVGFFFCLVYHQHFHPRWQYKIDKHLKYRQFLIEHWLPHIAFSNLATVSFERLIIAVAWLMTSNRITVIWSDWFCYWPLERFDSMGFFFKFYYFLYAHALSIKLLHFRIYRVTVIYFSLSIRNVRWIQLEKKQLNEWFFNIRDSLLVCMIHGSG